LPGAGIDVPCVPESDCQLVVGLDLRSSLPDVTKPDAELIVPSTILFVLRFPREPTAPWIWDDRRVEQCHGWFDVRVFPNMSVVQGAGVGGGSLVYANISVDAKADTFNHGWPPEIAFDMLLEQYAKVTHMLEIEPVPHAQWPERTKLLREAADKAGYLNKFRPLDLAVRFDPNWHYELNAPHNHARSQERTNVVGTKQGTCVHLGNCDIGCDVNARNTLDLNYLKGLRMPAPRSSPCTSHDAWQRSR
jgi:cholesterol oxidase